MAQVRARTMGGMLGIAVLLAGCAGNRSGQVQETPQAVPSIQQTRQQLEQEAAQIDNVLGAMKELTVASAATLPAAYRTFSSQVPQISSQAAVARRRAEAMRVQEPQYIDTWEKEAGPLSTPASKTGTAPRGQTVANHYGRLQEAAQMTGRAYPPFITYLQEVQRLLAERVSASPRLYAS